MKKAMIIITLALVGCSNSRECMHMHSNGMTLEVCSEQVVCVKSKEGSDSVKICQYQPKEEGQ